jgi:hypothetical protein
MPDLAITSRGSRAFPIRAVLEWYLNGALTTGSNKKEWIVPFFGRILDVICDSEVAGSGGVSDIIDIHLNGTTIYTTQARRPTLVVGDTGMFAEAAEPEIRNLRPGDILSLDVDQIATTGSSRFKAAIVVGLPS